MHLSHSVVTPRCAVFAKQFRPASCILWAMRALLVLGACAVAATFAAKPLCAESSAKPSEGNSVLELFTSRAALLFCRPMRCWLSLPRSPGIRRVAIRRLLELSRLARHAVEPGQQRSPARYAKARGDGRVYTPQVVVDGILHVNGSDETAIDQAMQDAARTTRWRPRFRPACRRGRHAGDQCRRRAGRLPYAQRDHLARRRQGKGNRLDHARRE